MLDITEKNRDWVFPVEERQFIPMGRTEPVQGWKTLVRTDGEKDEVLHVCRDTYTMLSHDDVVNSTYDAVKKANISNDFEFEVRCVNSGRQLEVEVLFNDLIIEPKKNDHIKYRIRAYNSLDGSFAYQTTADAMRLFCMNGCTTPDAISKVWARHTSQISTEGGSAKIVRGLENFHNQKDVYQAWAKHKIARDDAERFIKKCVVARSSKTSEEKHNQKQLETLMGQLDTEFKTLNKTKWALYNCLTHWATHTKETASPIRTTRHRENVIAKAMKTDMWETI